MSGTTYPRTPGAGINALTYAYVKSRFPAKYRLKPHERSKYDSTHKKVRADIDTLVRDEMNVPPEYLRFAIANIRKGETLDCPGAVDKSQELEQNGFIIDKSNIQNARKLLGIHHATLTAELRKFHGQVNLVQIPEGTVIYRIVGLTTESVKHGSVTNRILGTYWTTFPPNSFADEADMRAQLALLPNWNGDYAFVAVTLKEPVFALTGVASSQKIPDSSSRVLRGGAQQYYIHALKDSHLVSPITGKPLQQLLQPTLFGQKS